MTLEEIDTQLEELAKGIELCAEFKRGTLEEVDGWLEVLGSEVVIASVALNTISSDNRSEEAGRAESSKAPDPGLTSSSSTKEVLPSIDVSLANLDSSLSDDDIVTNVVDAPSNTTTSGEDALRAAFSPSDLVELAALELDSAEPVPADDFDEDEVEETTSIFNAGDIAATRASVPPPIPASAHDAFELDGDVVEIDMDDFELVEENESPSDEGEHAEGEDGEKKSFFKKIFG